MYLSIDYVLIIYMTTICKYVQYMFNVFVIQLSCIIYIQLWNRPYQITPSLIHEFMYLLA